MAQLSDFRGISSVMEILILDFKLDFEASLCVCVCVCEPSMATAHVVKSY